MTTCKLRQRIAIGLLALIWSLAQGTFTTNSFGAGAVKFKASVAFDDGHCGPVAIIPFLYADLPNGTSELEAKQLEKRFRPRPGIVLTIAGRRYALHRFPKRDHVSYLRMGWGLRAISVSKTVGQRELGKRATMMFTTISGKKISLQAHVEGAGCG